MIYYLLLGAAAVALYLFLAIGGMLMMRGLFRDPTTEDANVTDEIAVTEEMRIEGVRHAPLFFDDLDNANVTVVIERIYRAMAAVRPVAPKDRLAEACELDAALARVKAAEDRAAELRARALAAEQRLAALEPKPEPAVNPFREFPVDRRRIGG